MTKKQHMTSLYGSETVRKDDPRIEFRGVLDGVTAAVGYGAALCRNEGKERLEAELSDIQECLMLVMSAHVTGRSFELPTVGGTDMETLHEMSHDPKKHFGCYHFIPRPEQGAALSWINVIRTRVRDAERALIACYPDSEPDEALCRALNRISSALFVMMCRENSQFVK